MEVLALDFIRDYEKAIIPMASFLIGFVVSRFTMTMKEKKDHEQKQFENAKALMEAQNSRFQEFSATLQKYVNKQEEPTLDDFFSIATEGEKYFYQLVITSDAILADKVDSMTRDNSLVPKIKEAVQKSLPTFYSTLQSIAKKKDISYEGELRRENYESLYAVVERYAKAVT